MEASDKDRAGSARLLSGVGDMAHRGNLANLANLVNSPSPPTPPTSPCSPCSPILSFTHSLTHTYIHTERETVDTLLARQGDWLIRVSDLVQELADAMREIDELGEGIARAGAVESGQEYS